MVVGGLASYPGCMGWVRGYRGLRELVSRGAVDYYTINLMAVVWILLRHALQVCSRSVEASEPFHAFLCTDDRDDR